MQKLIDANALMNRIDHDTAFSALLEELLDEQPTIDAEPVRHGKWIEYPIADGMNQCSECGVLRFGESNYCPNCGARMDEE
jgi:rubrerythrin